VGPAWTAIHRDPGQPQVSEVNMSKSTIQPVIGAALYERLSELCVAARLQATTGKNYSAAALYVVLEALRVQAEHQGSHVSVYIAPVGGR